MNWLHVATEVGGTLLCLDHLPEKKIVSDQSTTKAHEFRAKADKYEQKAGQVQDAEAKRLLMEAAQNYRRLTALAERRGW